jgi:hypothetical protein
MRHHSNVPPLKVVYVREPLALISYQQGSTRVVAVDKQLMDQDEFLAEINERLIQFPSHYEELSGSERPSSMQVTRFCCCSSSKLQLASRLLHIPSSGRIKINRR